MYVRIYVCMYACVCVTHEKSKALKKIKINQKS